MRRRWVVHVLLSCLMMSLYTVFAADYTKEANPLLLTTLQLCVTAVIGLILWAVTDPGSITTINWSLETLSYIVIIAFFSKAYAYVMLMYSEKYCDAITVTVIAATDPVVTLILAVLSCSPQGLFWVQSSLPSAQLSRVQAPSSATAWKYSSDPGMRRSDSAFSTTTFSSL